MYFNLSTFPSGLITYQIAIMLTSAESYSECGVCVRAGRGHGNKGPRDVCVAQGLAGDCPPADIVNTKVEELWAPGIIST